MIGITETEWELWGSHFFQNIHGTGGDGLPEAAKRLYGLKTQKRGSKEWKKPL